MSTVSISYSSLSSAARAASNASRRYENYSDKLYDDVYRKLNNYTGSRTWNIQSAQTRVSNKISELSANKSRCDKLSTQLNNLKTECQNVDKAVRNEVLQITTNFKENNNIKNSKIENFMGHFLISTDNKFSYIRTFKNFADKADAKKEELKRKLKQWYDFEGGKDFLEGAANSIAEIAIAFVALAAAIAAVISAGWTVGLVATIGGCIIKLTNEIFNLNGEFMANLTDDPSTAKRRRKIDSLSEYINSSFWYGEDGQKYEYSKMRKDIARTIDTTDVIFKILGAACALKKLMANGYKWATGSLSKVEDIHMDNIFEKGIASKYIEKFREMRQNKDIGMRNFDQLWPDFISNLKDEYMFDKNIFDGDDKLNELKKVANIFKNRMSLGKDILNGDLKSLLLDDTILPGITTFHVYSMDDGKIEREGIALEDWFKPGKGFYKGLSKEIKINKIGDIENIFKEIGNIDIKTNLFEAKIPTICMSVNR